MTYASKTSTNNVIIVNRRKKNSLGFSQKQKSMGQMEVNNLPTSQGKQLMMKYKR